MDRGVGDLGGVCVVLIAKRSVDYRDLSGGSAFLPDAAEGRHNLRDFQSDRYGIQSGKRIRISLQNKMLRTNVALPRGIEPLFQP